MKLSVYNKIGEDTGKKVELKDSIFAIEPNDHAIYLDVKQYMANNRQGTHKTKERGEIRGSTRKIKRQKGTGTARAGSIKSPILRGGGRTFGPRPRNYSFKLNKKLKQLARKSALSYKAKNNEIIIVEDFTLETPKTKELVNVFNNLKIVNKKSLLVLPETNKNIYLSSRNLQSVNIINTAQLATYNIMNCAVILFFENSVQEIEKIFGN
ncbi:MAG: 50S ribosomal protein L4 [Bacteroidales bacterium]|nr:50S ribosomal protein L4 [Bacteroidales bacterium]